MPAFRWRSGGFPAGVELTRHDIHWAMIFLAIIAMALVAQAVGVLISGAFGAKLLNRVNSIRISLRPRRDPSWTDQRILKDLAPKVRRLRGCGAVSSTVRAKVEEFGETMSELNDTMREINGRRGRR